MPSFQAMQKFWRLRVNNELQKVSRNNPAADNDVYSSTFL